MHNTLAEPAYEDAGNGNGSVQRAWAASTRYTRFLAYGFPKFIRTANFVPQDATADFEGSDYNTETEPWFTLLYYIH